ncbi:MAG: TonB-dependent receptor [Pseudohongiella sp.]|nr:TonB-dependent receptor [Pseudohongiella sp.]
MPALQRKKTNPHKIKALSAAISFALFPLTSPVYAQSSDQPQLEEVVVTGSRITRFEGDYVAPVLSLGAEQMQQSGKVNIEDFVSEVAALIGSTGSFESASGSGGTRTGINSLNMRNLGTNRTLVLVNGRRHVSSVATGEPLVDTNTIPTALIDRVDILTGGASAVYGADAVSGAVNFVLKNDFEGFAMRTQAGMSGQSDAEEFFASFVWGNNFAEGRGNVTASYEYRKQESLQIFERDYGLAKRVYMVNNPAEFRKTDDPTVPDRIVAGDRRYIFTAPDGRYDVLGFNTATGRALRFGDIKLNARGEPFDQGIPVSGSASLGGDGTPTAYFTSQFLPDTDTHAINLNGRYDISERATAFSELKYVRTGAINPQSSSFTSVLEIGLDNPFIPPAFFNALTGIQDPVLNLARDDLELRALNDNTRETTRVVLGLRGELTDWLDYEVSYNHGITDVTARLQNMRREDRYFAALDVVRDPVTGQATCRSNLNPAAVPPHDAVVSSYNPSVWGDPANSTFTPGPNSGCAPFNPFYNGTDGYFTPGVLSSSNPNAAAVAFITGGGVPLIDRGEVKQTVVNGFVAGNTSGLGFELPAGPVDFVFGGEYREEKIANNVDPIRSNPNGLTPLNFERNSSAAYDVAEAFTEFSVPVFQDLAPFLQALRLDGAYRYSDYSTIGETSAYSVGLNWTLTDSMIVRGSLGQSVRSPNLNELFSPDNEGSFRPEDPCEVFNLGSQTANAVANCRTALTPLGVDPSNFVSASPVGRPGLIGGNPSLQEETSDTKTIGVVITPTILPGFVATLDAWQIDMAQGILYPSANEIVKQCYDAPTLDNPFCSLFTRASSGIVGAIIDLQQRPVNVSDLSTSGVDFSFNYTTELWSNAGTLSLGLNGSYLESLLTQPTVAPVQVEQAGMVTTLLGQHSPEWVANFSANWARGPLSLNYRLHHQSGLDIFTKDQLARQPDLSDYTQTRRLYVHDIQADYRFNDGIKGYFGINNIRDREPDATYLNTPIGARGRFFYMGLSAEFENLRSLSNPFR